MEERDSKKDVRGNVPEQEDEVMTLEDRFKKYEVRRHGVKDEHNSPSAFLDMPTAHKAELLELIRTELQPRTSFNPRLGSYALKHRFEDRTSFGYVGNGEMKGAMLVAGYRMRPVDGGVNGWFDADVRERSPHA
jgi:hypothetical protein